MLWYIYILKWNIIKDNKTLSIFSIHFFLEYIFRLKHFNICFNSLEDLKRLFHAETINMNWRVMTSR